MRFTRGFLYAATLCITLLFGPVANGYEQPTHQVITGEAVNNSILTIPFVLQNIGLSLASTFPNTEGTRKDIPNLFMDGARFEDGFSPFFTIRSLRHFYNPITSLGLDIPLLPTQVASPDWALASPGSISGQESSYWDARKSYFDALTNPSEAVREAAFGETFQFLGQVVHHLQDMAQPQHVRNDVHCDTFLPCALIGAFAPSRYEKWATQLGADIPTNPAAVGYNNFSSVAATFNSPRRFWNTEPASLDSPIIGQGIAEFTNRNFVSAGTNFGTGLFPSPVLDLSKKTETTIQKLCLSAKPECPQQIKLLPTPVFFYGNTVRDNFLGPSADKENQRASTSSIFDQDLVDKGLSPVFSLNRFNFDAAYEFLIPRAVAYSAGMINYFFRGFIDLLHDPNNIGTFVIMNLGNEPMSGEFALYYDDTGNNRTLLKSWPNTSIPAHGQVNVGTIPPDPTNPAPKKPGEFMLVFTGTMGQETVPQSGIGAVVGRIVNIPAYVVTDLGSIPGQTQFTPRTALSISRNGALVAGVSGDSNFERAFLWNSASGMKDLGDLPGAAFGYVARGVNDSGLVVGSTFVWSVSSGMQMLDTSGSEANGVNNSGQIVGHRPAPGGGSHAFLWSSASGFQDLGVLPSNTCGGVFPSSVAFAINSSGQAVGYSSVLSPSCLFQPDHAILWSGGSLQDLGVLNGDSTIAFAISDNSYVAGYGGPFGIRHAFLWSPSSGMQDLGTLPGKLVSQAFGVNSNGQVVGSSGEGFASRAFLWSSTSGMQDLSTLPEVLAAGWSTLLEARAINDAGQIVGSGLQGGITPSAFLLRPTRRP